MVISNPRLEISLVKAAKELQKSGILIRHHKITKKKKEILKKLIYIQVIKSEQSGGICVKPISGVQLNSSEFIFVIKIDKDNHQMLHYAYYTLFQSPQ